MLLTRSIRMKLALGLALVFILLAFSTVCSIIGVISYSRMVNDLELSITNSPRRDELVASLGALIQPLSVNFPENRSPDARQRAAELQHQRFVDVFADVRERVREFEQKWQRLPTHLWHSERAQVPFRTMFSTVDRRLNEIERDMDRLADPRRRHIQVRAIIQTVAELIEIAHQLPDPANRLGQRLHEAKADYLTFLNLVTFTGVVSLLLMIGLTIWGNQLISRPIRRLHQGVIRISEGDYHYRLNVETRCEISHLARAFNEMAARIEQDQLDKEREIEERSKQLVLSERLAGAGFLASGVAHEINNPLTVIMTAAYALECRFDDEAVSDLTDEDRAEILEYLQMIQSESKRCEQITRKLLDFSYGRADERNVYDVTAIVEEVVGMIGHLGRYQDRNLSVTGSIPIQAWVNAPEIKQVVLNLVANALDATDPGGHVNIALKEFPNQVEVAVQDDGCGMTPEQMENIFDPFFTTKEVGKGTGLGLSITHRIVRDHGGTLEVESAGPGQGARFTLRLPKQAAVRAA